jgi:hypothetical protein
MLDPLQNILYCADNIVDCQSKRPNMSWGQHIGELDHACEIQRQLEEIKFDKTK